MTNARPGLPLRIAAQALLNRLFCAVLSGCAAYGVVRAGGSSEQALIAAAVLALACGVAHQRAKRTNPPQAKPFKERARGAAG